MNSIYEAILNDYPPSPNDPVVKSVLGEQIKKAMEKAMEKAKADAKAEGEAKGMAEGKAAAAADFLRTGLLSPDVIAATLGMPLSKVLAIRDGMV